MCDTRTWVFKLLLVFIIIHFSRIPQCHGADAAASTGIDVVASGTAIDVAADISIDDDSFETTSSPEDSLSASQRTNFNSTFNSRQNEDKTPAQYSLSSFRRTTNRLASDEGPDGDREHQADVDDDDDRSNEQFIGNQRKFNNEGVAVLPQQQQQQQKEPEESSKRASILKILQGVDYIGDAITAPSTPQSTSIVPQQPPASWVGNTNNANNDDDDDDEDVDEILQPMEMASDKHHYHSNNGGRVMSPGAGYSIDYNPNRNEESSGSNNLKETPVTNRIKSGGYTSAFEQHKALIRNSRRYGHKTHKKKYKDYLHYNPPTTTSFTPTTTTVSSLQKDILARDRIFNSDDIPRQYYQGHVNYFTNTDANNHEENKRIQDPTENFRSYHTPRPHHHHLRSGGRYRHIGVTPKTNRPHTQIYPDYNGMNYQHLGSRAMQQHQKELEKKIEEYSQYYAKWPHLAQVEDQLFKDERADMLYPEEGGSNPQELVLSSVGDDEDENLAAKEEEDQNLPPYIKKYRRRNKQLRDLLEGTQPPSTPVPQWSSSVLKPGPIDGSYQNHHHQHRKHHNHRHHQRSHRHKNPKWQIEDLFEEQRANPNNPNKTTVYTEVVQPTSIPLNSRSTTITTTTSSTTLSPFDELLKHETEHLKLLQENKLPAEDISISRELYDWAIDTSKDQPFDLESNDDEGDYVDLNSRRSRWKTTNRNASPVKAITTTTRRPVASVRRPSVYGSIIRSPPTSTAKPINSFVYHRVVESPRAVGAGQTGRKQRLPFVAITDRRLETSRKGMGNAGELARKDFEQNHFPMP